ncbi:MAG: zinc ribbon domain-containing protein [Oscillospiraceae bacterium]|jgi:RNA polymerase subunit RPABC4/transcription elongation factor Spt4|nr:zinc ribbon domain-containing protein [Oscillospiraceae bacterium]
MSNAMASLLVLLPLMALVLMLPILMGVYVYRDAKARRMDAVLWTLVAVLVPSFIGLIIYLVIRGNHTNLNCPNCNQPVSADYALCPHCGARMKTACPACGTPAESGWKLCPKCGTELPETQDAIYPPAAPQRDRKLMRIIVAAVLIPIILFIVGVAALGLSSYGHSSAGSMRYSSMHWLEDASQAVANWAAACDEQGKGVYVLQRKAQTGDVYTAYVYMNEYKGDGSGKGFVGKAEVVQQDHVVEWRFTTTSARGFYVQDKLPDYELSEVETRGYGVEGIRIFVDGVEVEAVVTE